MLNPSFKVKEDKKEKDFGRFIVEPLEPGFGHTVGVALRRALLTGIDGAAVTSVKIEGASHMFSTLKGLKEDVIELILNLKTLRIKLAPEKEKATIRLSKTGPGDVTGKDIEVSDGVEVVDKDHYIGSLADKKSKLEMEMTVERGLGYSLAEERPISTVGVIPVDAIFSPIKKVNYKVEQTRVGRQTNFDKLVLDMWTDGSIDSRDALDKASRIVVSYFTQIFDPTQTSTESTPEEKESPKNEYESMTIDELDLPTRIYNSLRNAGIETVGQLLSTSRKDLMGYRNLGAKSLYIIKESLDEKNVPFEV